MTLIEYLTSEDQPVEVEPAEKFGPACAAGNEGWICTRKRGHTAEPRKHQAGGPDRRVRAEWDQEESA